jgi:adenosylcobinamide kinase/adenosylcobinamide-phosphate guanylyltransferase
VGEKIMTEIRDAEVVVVDCVTLLVSNVLLAIGGEGEAEADKIDYASAEGRVVAEIEGLIRCIKSTKATFMIVSNEVGMGVVPVYKAGRIYRDLLGRANQLLAQQADDVYLMVAGIPWRLKGKD